MMSHPSSLLLKSKFKLAIICGGPSSERGISLNSARSVMDHVTSSFVEIIPIYVDVQKSFYLISSAQLYSNTPADFDFKLLQTAKELDHQSLKNLLQSVDLVFPVIHGAFGEDGEIQAILEKFNIPFVGHGHTCCQWMFRKNQAAETLKNNGFATLPHVVISSENHPLIMIENFFREHDLKRAVIKPTVGGSSIGVYSVKTPQEAFSCFKNIVSRGLDTQALLEPFCTGREFTVVVFENLNGDPVALLPTEIEISYEQNELFDYRKKYLPTNQAAYHTPPRFSPSIVEAIRNQAKQIFTLFGMRDFVRLDGWLTKEGEIYFTDINPISGLEQNSFLFRQASILGMTHRQALNYLIQKACLRYGITFPSEKSSEIEGTKRPVYVLFGSHNAERQVSLMSGTNVWLKLLQSPLYSPIPFFVDKQGSIWEIPYPVTLNHTVEEIYANCLIGDNEKWQSEIREIQSQLGISSSPYKAPIEMTRSQFLQRAKNQDAFVFIAMHGGEGENGEFQKQLEQFQIPFNGSGADASALCMDKYLTGQTINQLNDPDLLALSKKSVALVHLIRKSKLEFEQMWNEWCHELGCRRLIVKPRCDGCSAGVALLHTSADLERYCHFLFQHASIIPSGTFENQSEPIEMPSSFEGEFIFEPYIETDAIRMDKNQLHCILKEGWLELTVGVLERAGKYHALNPSITVAEGAILSLEEKFQGGTGINLTPPPVSILSPASTQKIKRLVEKAAQGLGIENYARVDIFFNRITEKMVVIEANTLPALTPSTVIYHQGLEENPSLSPLAFLNLIICSKLDCDANRSSSCV